MQPRTFAPKTCGCPPRAVSSRGCQEKRQKSRLERTGASKKGYDFETDCIFGSTYATTSETPSKSGHMDVRLADGMFMGGNDFFSDIEEWVDFGDVLRCVLSPPLPIERAEYDHYGVKL